MCEEEAREVGLQRTLRAQKGNRAPVNWISWKELNQNLNTLITFRNISESLLRVFCKIEAIILPLSPHTTYTLLFSSTSIQHTNTHTHRLSKTQVLGIVLEFNYLIFDSTDNNYHCLAIIQQRALESSCVYEHIQIDSHVYLYRTSSIHFGIGLGGWFGVGWGERKGLFNKNYFRCKKETPIIITASWNNNGCCNASGWM